MKHTVSRLLLITVILSLLASVAMAGQEAAVPYENADWGIAMEVPAAWHYQAGSPPPAADRPFAASNGTLSSRDTFYIGAWAEDSSFAAAPAIRLGVYYTSAGTVERIEGVKDKLMDGLISKANTPGKSYARGDFEIVACGENRAAVLSMHFVEGGKDYIHWNFLLPFPMTLFHFEGIAAKESAPEMKQMLTDMVASFTSK